jgi:hypothetical protein
MADDGVSRLDLLAAPQRVVPYREKYTTAMVWDAAAASHAVVRLSGFHVNAATLPHR